MGVFRLLLALSVMTGHMGKAILGFHQLRADIAVQCFYIISGFYMALILTEKYNRPRDYLLFLQQRFLRIYPTYGIILVLGMAFQAAMFHDSVLNGWKAWIEYGPRLNWVSWIILAFSNVSLIGQDWLLFFAVNPSTGVLFPTAHFQLETIPTYPFFFCRPSWSLGVELTFYVMAPFLVRRRLGIQAAVLLASVAVRIALQVFFHLSDDPWSYRFFPSELAFFMAGSLGYQVYRTYGASLAKFAVGKSWLFWIFWLSVFTYSRLPGNGEWRADCFLLVTAAMVPLLFAAFSKNKWDRALGDLSYPLYLMHMLILFLLDPIRPSPLYSTACLFLALVSACLFYYFIENRIDLYRASLFRRQHREEKLANPAP